jgi:hypothetical protein
VTTGVSGNFRLTSRLSTTGTRAGLLDRNRPASRPNFLSRNSWYENKSGQKAWFWVDAETFPDRTRGVRKAALSGRLFGPGVAFVETDETQNPVAVGSLGSHAVISKKHYIAYLIEDSFGLASDSLAG